MINVYEATPASESLRQNKRCEYINAPADGIYWKYCGANGSSYIQEKSLNNVKAKDGDKDVRGGMAITEKKVVIWSEGHKLSEIIEAVIEAVQAAL